MLSLHSISKLCQTNLGKFPEMNGLEVLKALRSNTLWSDIPVTVCTGGKSDKNIQKAQNLGANAFIPKPLKTYDVIQSMMKLHNYALANI